MKRSPIKRITSRADLPVIRWDRNSVNECKYCELDWRSIQPENLELKDTIPSHLLFAACGLEQLGQAELQLIGDQNPILNLGDF